jgi:hypothetical protein
MPRAVVVRRSARGLGAAVLLLAAAAPAAAGASWHLGVRAGAFEPQQAADTYDALYGGTMLLVGVQAEARFARGWYLALSVDRGDADGELVGVGPGGGLVPIGEPTDLTMMPIHLTVGGVVGGGRPWSFYYGGGPSLLRWKEDNAVAPQDESDDGFHAVAGVRRAFGRAEAAAEARWSTIPDALGEGGVSQRFGEDDWGGLALHAVVAFRIGG